MGDGKMTSGSGTDKHESMVGHSFAIEFQGVQFAFVNEVTGLKAEMDVIEQKSVMANNGRPFIIKHPGKNKAGEITITRGLTKDDAFTNWMKQAQSGDKKAKKNGKIHIMAPDLSKIRSYEIIQGWPKSLEIGSLKAGDTSVLTEKIVVTYEEMKPL